MKRLDQKYVFSGIDQQIDDVLQDKNKSKDLANSRVLPKYSILSKRKGVKKYNSQVIWGGKYMRGLFQYFSGSTKRIFALVGTDIFYDNNDGVFVKAGLTLTDQSDHLLSGVSYKGRAYMANNHDAMITYNGSTFGNAGLPVPVLGVFGITESLGALSLGTYGYKITYIYDGYQETDGSAAYSKTTGNDFLEDACGSITGWTDNGQGAVTLSIIGAPIPDSSRSSNFMRATFANGGGPSVVRGFEKTQVTRTITTNFTILYFYVRSSVNLSNLTVGLYDGATLREQWVIGPPTAPNLVAGVWTKVELSMGSSQSVSVSTLKFTTEFGDDPATFTLDISDIYYDYSACSMFLDSIPVSADPRVTARRIYRTTVGGSVYYLLTEIANNTATTYTDNTADVDLGTAIPPISINNGLTYIKDLVLLQDRLFGISTLQGATSTVVCSTVGLPDSFPAAFDPDDSSIGGPIEVAKDDGDELMRLFGMEDWLYCFKKNYIYKVYVKGDPSTSWEIRILHNVGSTAYFGVVKGENDFYFYHTTGIYHIIDYSIEKISEPIRDFIKNISTAMSANVALCIDRTRKKLLVAFCDPYITPTSVNNSLAVFDLVTKEWESVDTDIYIKSFLEKDDGTILYGDYIDGYVKKLNQYEDDINLEKSIASIDSETWAGGADDTTNYKDGLKGYKLTANTSSTDAGATSFATAISLDSWSNGDLSNDDDFIDFWLYHTTRANITSIVLDIDVNDGGYSDKYSYTVLAADLTSGDNAWTKIHVKKSAFTRTGDTSGKDWATVKDITFTLTTNGNGAASVTFDDIRMVADQRKAIATHYKTKAISPVSADIDHHFVDLYLECRKFVDSDLTIKYDIEHGKKTKELTLWTAKNLYFGITDNTNTRIMFRRKNDLVHVLNFAAGGGAYKSICADDDYYYPLVGATGLSIIKKDDAHTPATVFGDNFVGSDIDDTLWTHTQDGSAIHSIADGKLVVSGYGSVQMTTTHEFTDTGIFEYKFNITGSAAITQIPYLYPMFWIADNELGLPGGSGYYVMFRIDTLTEATAKICLTLFSGSSYYVFLDWYDVTILPDTDYTIKIAYDSTDDTLTNFKCYVNDVLAIDYDLPVGSLTATYKTNSFPYTEVTGQVYTGMLYRGVGNNSTNKKVGFIVPATATDVVSVDYFWGDYTEVVLPSVTGAEGICCDADYLYVSDYAGDRINIYNKVEPITLQATFGTTGDGDDEFAGPGGICCDDLYLYIVDMNNNRVKKHLKASPYTFVASYGRAGSGQSRSYGVGNYELKSPFGICCDFEYLWITDAGNYRIMKIRKDMSEDCFITKIGGYAVSGNDGFNLPRGIAVDDNYIYIVDGGNNKVQKREKDLLVFVEEYGTSGSGNDQLSNPYDVAINDLDYIIPDRIHTKVAIERVGKCISLDFRQKKVGQNMEIMAMDLSYRSTKLRGK